jgi:hypothetical protein
VSATIHRCGDCHHQADDHSHGWSGGFPPRIGPCSMGGCACRHTPADVQALNEPVEIQSWPGFDHTTGRWAQR